MELPVSVPFQNHFWCRPNTHRLSIREYINQDADALLLVTEWKQFRMPSFGVMKKSMKNALIIDGRNIYDAKELADAGFEYSAIGC